MAIELAPLEDDDIAVAYLRLVRGSTVNIHPFPYSVARLRRWVEDVEGHDGVFFAVRNPGDGSLAGVVALRVAWVSQTAQVVEFVFDPAFPSAATEAAKALVHYVEGTLRLRRLWLITVDAEILTAVEAAGFEREGILRRHFLHYGRYRDGLVAAYVSEGRE